ncbi:radical SAM protein [Actinoplanes sp. NPDC051470]|uniref:radical SAM protein n=1 Tax=Actinoplanes sp. NPDC051470 TaxID=3157224 RepID=UPI003444BDC9
MPILKDARIEINSVVMSTDANQVGLDLNAEEQDDTAFGDNARARLSGLQDPGLSVGFNQNFTNGGVDQLLFALWSAGAVVTCKVRPTTAAISTGNAEYVGGFLPSKYTPFGNSVGDAAKANIQWPYGSGTAIARNTV